MNATALVRTDKAERYLGTLCKHFTHKVSVSFEQGAKEIALPLGTYTLTVQDGGLMLTATAADQASLERVAEVITSYFERFALRENAKLNGTCAAA
ncbi:DUF2218 domain-containing protein [Salipiger sp. 1_MG-2023]|uniref:DUF2218 domain-containing protein n=1 Tax=Salipiger sp. 1_MG-2023 TaxID=3062665 RepID=UPI0026E41AE0|nr:DUF2218 domain-containing protein [Salipiger sp. 1_MG-2023]MDO6586128.1 DUF2218 domain-containing protein [Salipiger sp. 1_MG-2023]